MAVGEKIKSHIGAVDYFKEILFYNNHIEKPCINGSDQESNINFRSGI